MNTSTSKHRHQIRLESDALDTPRRKRTTVAATCAKPLDAAPLSAALTPDRLPDPWLIDSEYLLRELDRIRELALRVPLTQASYLPTNSVVDALYRLQQTLRYVLLLRHDGQNSFRKKAEKADRADEDTKRGKLPQAFHTAPAPKQGTDEGV